MQEIQIKQESDSFKLKFLKTFELCNIMYSKRLLEIDSKTKSSKDLPMGWNYRPLASLYYIM